MKEKQKKPRYSFMLVLIMTLTVFLVLLVTSVLTVGLIMLLMRLDVLTIHPETTAADAKNLLLFMALGSLVLGTAITFGLSTYPLKPVKRLLQSMHRLASGDYSARISFGFPFGKTPVVQEFTDSFNAMAAELGSTEMLRRDFLNHFSHEFKTPIVSIAGFARLVRTGEISEEQKEEYLEIIEEESLRLSRMAENVLNLTKIENQTILTGVTRYNLSEQLRNCLLLLEEKWSGKELELQLEFGEHEICGNRELLQEMWLNLLDNAVKFAPRFAAVAVSIRETERDICVKVSNTGSSIPAEEQSKIFGKFYQADPSHATEGNGIGLTVVKRVAELHGGAVSVESRENMTAFAVTLPKGREMKV
ncbi:MAG: HAMP domain-containing histidine kinase [Oscillospiraceae bacterium]|nr:HAMP domain-containing histidine kinase [Oscillospiraceae bacterium]